MMKTPLLTAMMLVGAAGVAHAGGSPGTIGVGAEYQLSGVGGGSVNYDGGDWHAGGALGFVDLGRGDDDSAWQVGGRFYYHIHSTTDADFSVGGALGVLNVPTMGGDDVNLMYLEPGVQIRVFLAANVALSVSTGIVIGLSDADGVALTGSSLTGAQTFGTDGFSFGGGAGIHYYFF